VRLKFIDKNSLKFTIVKFTALNYAGITSMLVSKIVTSKLLPQISNILKSSKVTKQVFWFQCCSKPNGFANLKKLITAF